MGKLNVGRASLKRPPLDLRVTRAGAGSILVHVTDEHSSRWLDLTPEQAEEFRVLLGEALRSKGGSWKLSDGS